MQRVAANAKNIVATRSFRGGPGNDFDFRPSYKWASRYEIGGDNPCSRQLSGKVRVLQTSSGLLSSSPSASRLLNAQPYFLQAVIRQLTAKFVDLVCGKARMMPTNDFEFFDPRATRFPDFRRVS
jgi:hypothetical protein